MTAVRTLRDNKPILPTHPFGFLTGRCCDLPGQPSIQKRGSLTTGIDLTELLPGDATGCVIRPAIARLPVPHRLNGAGPLPHPERRPRICHQVERCKTLHFPPDRSTARCSEMCRIPPADQ